MFLVATVSGETAVSTKQSLTNTHSDIKTDRKVNKQKSCIVRMKQTNDTDLRTKNDSMGTRDLFCSPALFSGMSHVEKALAAG